jgi:hypothetical protein
MNGMRPVSESFSQSHVATLLRYVGTSFVAGAVAHGAFSESRSAVTAAIGVGTYVIGSVIQVRLDAAREHAWGFIILAGAVAAVGIGFFTGGLQHFPDSPDRSVWVVPLGFLLSGVGLLLLRRAEGRSNQQHERRDYIYLLVGLLIVTGLSASGWAYWHQHQEGGHHGEHDGGHDGDHPH